jgi:hypothetical protein
MNKLQQFFDKHYQKVVLILVILIFVNTCGNPTKSLNKRIDVLSNKVDSLELITVTKKDLQIEGLKSEKRMIQSTDRKLFDMNRQSEIDKEISELEK